jgi:hypothetical protein
MGKNTIRRSGGVRARVEVVYHGKDEGALREAYRLLARFFSEAGGPEGEGSERGK